MGVLNSERLYFKEFREEDFPLFYSIFSNEAIMKYALRDVFTTKEDTKEYFNQVLMHNNMNEKRTIFEYAVYTNDETFIGFADFEIHFKNATGGFAEIGYFILPDYWGNGYATEIANAQLKYCFEAFHLHKITACCNALNQSSEKIMKKIGMIKEGELRNQRFKNNQWVNELRYGILIEEWIQKV